MGSSIVHYSEPYDISVEEPRNYRDYFSERNVLCGRIRVLPENIAIPFAAYRERFVLGNTPQTLHFTREVAGRIRDAIAVYTDEYQLFLPAQFPTKIVSAFSSNWRAHGA